jgi:transcriptional regulator with XRE-family HTH domain
MRFAHVSISVGQVRAARGLIGWSQDDLAREAKIGRATLADFESGKREPYNSTLAAIRVALESAGVEFTNGGRPGVRLTPVGVLHQLSRNADLDGVLKLQGLKRMDRTAKTPWQIVCTADGIECLNADGVVVGSVRPDDTGGLMFDPEMVGEYYDDMPVITKLEKHWVTALRERDAERYHASHPSV